MSDGTRTRGRRDHNPELYQLSYAHQATRSIAAFGAPGRVSWDAPGGSREARGAMFHLTFDDGPDPVWTPAVLDALETAGARATFFVLGERAAAHPEMVQRMVATGHGVEVHGHGHLRHPDTPRECVEGDLAAALVVLSGLGIAPRLWRVPWGDLAVWSGEIAAANGLTLAGWTADTNDWRGGDAESMLAAVEPLLRPVAVVLAHDGLGPGALRTDCSETVRLVRPLVDAGRRRGMEPVPLKPRADLPAGNLELGDAPGAVDAPRAAPVAAPSAVDAPRAAPVAAPSAVELHRPGAPA